VTRKIITAAVNIKLGSSKPLILGNLDALRDWGYAPDYVRAMWLMLQADTPDDYVVATGETHRVQDFVSVAFSSLGLDYEQHVKVDPSLFRPTENVPLCGNASKARAKLGWSRTLTLNEIIRTMIDAEMAARNEHEQ
jgi:GDPmannose 4,6-dehydratase